MFLKKDLLLTILAFLTVNKYLTGSVFVQWENVVHKEEMVMRPKAALISPHDSTALIVVPNDTERVVTLGTPHEITWDYSSIKNISVFFLETDTQQRLPSDQKLLSGEASIFKHIGKSTETPQMMGSLMIKSLYLELPILAQLISSIKCRIKAVL